MTHRQGDATISDDLEPPEAALGADESLARSSDACPTALGLTVVIPAYNEVRRLGRTLESIGAHFAGQDYEVLVVDDGSTDGTAELAGRYPRVRVLRQERNQGKGAAIRRGMLEAEGQWVLFSDADLSTPIEEYVHLRREAERVGAAIAIASRGLRQATIEVSQPIYRVLMGKIFNLMVQALVLPGIWDTQCGFKLFRKDAARAVFARTQLDGFGFDVEALYIARRLGLRMSEVPVRWRNDADTKVSPVRDSLRMFRDLWVVRRTHHRLRP